MASLEPWRQQYGYHNNTWAATIARNCYIVAAILCVPESYVQNFNLDSGTSSWDAVTDSYDASNTSYSPGPASTSTSTEYFTSQSHPSQTVSPMESSQMMPPPITMPDAMDLSTSIDSADLARTQFVCTYCDMHFSTQFNLNKHNAKRPKRCLGPRDTVTAYICRFCNKSSTTKHNLKTHEASFCKKARRARGE
jgi:hypothetical protein